MSEGFIYALGKLPVIGRLLRRLARRYPEGSVVTIKRGPLAGAKWKRHHRYVSGYWLGIVEPIIQRAFIDHIKPGQCVWDIGANAGFFTLMAARMVGEQGFVVAFDPQPSNRESINEQIELNGLGSRVSIRSEAISDAPGSAQFSFGGAGDPAGRLGTSDARRPDTLEVTCTTIDAVLREERAPDVIKMDIEGAELAAFKGASELLAKHRPLVILEVHAPGIGDELRALLAERYEWLDIEEQTIDHKGDPAPWHVLLKPREA